MKFRVVFGLAVWAVFGVILLNRNCCIRGISEGNFGRSKCEFLDVEGEGFHEEINQK